MVKRNLIRGYRQGEVGIMILGKGKTLPAEWLALATEVPDNVIIEGEKSGHKHAVKNGKLYEKDGKMYLQAQEDCEVIHPEHKPIRVPKGLYEIRIQKEYKDGEAKKVKD